MADGNATLFGYTIVSVVRSPKTGVYSSPKGLSVSVSANEISTLHPSAAHVRSYITQIMQNYFDPTDRRPRENPTCIDSQLLNMAAVELEDLILRTTREVQQSFQTVPTNIDNAGVYFAGVVPDAFITDPDQTAFNDVVGIQNNSPRPLFPFDDTLPVPNRITLDVDSRISLTNPVLFTFVGQGDDQDRIYTVQYAYPGPLPIPNKISFWVDQIGLNPLVITISITGETHPRPAWMTERRKTTEVVTLTSEGFGITRNRWATIDKVVIRSLPTGVRVRGWSIPFAMPATLDSARPYVTPQDRDTLYPRYWQISNSEKLLKEVYRAEGFTGLEPVNSYLLAEDLVDIAVEPNTYGIYAISNKYLYYADRREVMPSLAATGIFAEPLYGLQVTPNILKTGSTRHVNLSGIPYGGASNIFQYRYVVDGVNSILPSGALAPINAGWQRGAPVQVSFPLLSIKDYTFTLEMQDRNGNTTVDVVPWKNARFLPLQRIDISDTFDNIAGLAFDSYNVLWVWTGTFAIPIQLHYDAYVLDAESKLIFATEPFDSLQVR